MSKDYPPRVPGGISRAVQMQAHHLAAAGVEVHVITKAQGGAAGTRQDAGVIVHELPEPDRVVPPELYYLEIPVWSYMAAAKFAELDSSLRFDIVEAPDYRGEALHLAPRRETALVVWLHSPLIVAWNCQPGYVRTPADDAWHALEMAALQRADLLLAPSQLLLDTTAELLGERMRPAELMPLLFDPQQFPVRRRERGDGPVRVLFYGRFEARKNPELAMYAAAAARACGQRVELTLLGQDTFNYRERVLASLQVELGLQDVSYLPHADIETLRAVLAGTDVAILASRFDNSPMTIFEALSSGVPVITSDRVGTASWIEPADGLVALPIDDPLEFGRRAAAAIADPAWIASGPRAAKRMREMFSPTVVTERLFDCYGRLMTARGRTQQGPAATKARMPLEGTRRTAVLAFADELIANPSLLRAWACEFDGSDEITLVIHAPDWSAQDVESKLGPLVTGAGLDGDDACDLLAHAVPASAQIDARLAAGATAILSRRTHPAPFAALPIVDQLSIATLRDDLDRRPDRSRKRWTDGLDEETAFWLRWLRDRGGPWPDDYAWRMDPDSELQPEIRAHLASPSDAKLRILDVGSGPLTILGKRWGSRSLEITAVDPLAERYSELFRRLDLKPIVMPLRAEAERLAETLGENRFDLVYARNCLDHGYDPLRSIQQMLKVAKPGRTVLLEHAIDEGQQMNYAGPHQWNFRLENDRFVIWQPGLRVDAHSVLEQEADVQASAATDGSRYMRVVLHKRRS